MTARASASAFDRNAGVIDMAGVDVRRIPSRWTFSTSG